MELLSSWNSFQAFRLTNWLKLESWLSPDIQEESPRNSFLMSSFLAFLPHKLTPPECPDNFLSIRFYVHGCFFCVCICALLPCLVSTEVRKGLRSSRTRVAGGCERLIRVLGTKPESSAGALSLLPRSHFSSPPPFFNLEVVCRKLFRKQGPSS